MPVLDEMEVGKKYYINPENVFLYGGSSILISDSVIVTDYQSEKGIVITNNTGWNYIGKKPDKQKELVWTDWKVIHIEPKFVTDFTKIINMKVGEIGYTSESALYHNSKGECFISTSWAATTAHYHRADPLILRISDTEFVTSTPLSTITEASDDEKGIRITYWEELEQFVSRPSDRCADAIEDWLRDKRIDLINETDGEVFTKFASRFDDVLQSAAVIVDEINWSKVKYIPNLPIDFAMSIDPAYRNPFVWITRKDESIPVPELSDEHLNNIIISLSKSKGSKVYHGHTVEQWLVTLMAEQCKRKSNSQTTTNTNTTMFSTTVSRANEAQRNELLTTLHREMMIEEYAEKRGNMRTDHKEYMKERELKEQLIAFTNTLRSLEQELTGKQSEFTATKLEAKELMTTYNQDAILFDTEYADEELGNKKTVLKLKAKELNKSVKSLQESIKTQTETIDAFVKEHKL